MPRSRAWRRALSRPGSSARSRSRSSIRSRLSSGSRTLSRSGLRSGPRPSPRQSVCSWLRPLPKSSPRCSPCSGFCCRLRSLPFSSARNGASYSSLSTPRSSLCSSLRSGLRSCVRPKHGFSRGLTRAALHFGGAVTAVRALLHSALWLLTSEFVCMPAVVPRPSSASTSTPDRFASRRVRIPQTVRREPSPPTATC